MKPLLILAMDRASVRRTDQQGFLHVDTSPISKANVCPYMGREIPGWQELGLDGDKIYNLFRDPDELAKAADTFNNLPLLSRHVPVTADSIPDELIVGSTGSHAAFDGTYLNNSLSVWKRDAINGINSNRKRELSCAYSYTPIMEPGIYAGINFDGKMASIKGNHVAIVFEGRAGPDVVIGDENMLKSRAAYMVSGALMAYVAPKLASGQSIKLDVAMDGANAATFTDPKKAKAFAGKIVKLTEGKLAQDETLDADGIVSMIDGLALDGDNDEIADPVKVDPKPEPKADPEPKKDEPVAMDAATVDAKIAAAVAATATDLTARHAALRTAERDVADVIGEVACDSAAEVYRAALDHYKVDLTGVAEDSFAALFRTTKAVREAKPQIAQDARRTGASPLAAIVPDLKPMGVI